MVVPSGKKPPVRRLVKLLLVACRLLLSLQQDFLMLSKTSKLAVWLSLLIHYLLLNLLNGCLKITSVVIHLSESARRRAASLWSYSRVSELYSDAYKNFIHLILQVREGRLLVRIA